MNAADETLVEELQQEIEHLRAVLRRVHDQIPAEVGGEPHAISAGTCYAVQHALRHYARDIDQMPPGTLQKRLERILNGASAENDSNTPDFILARYLMACLDAFNAATTRRDHWYNVELYPGSRRIDQEAVWNR